MFFSVRYKFMNQNERDKRYRKLASEIWIRERGKIRQCEYVQRDNGCKRKKVKKN